MKKYLKSIPEGMDKKWRVELDGQPVEANYVSISHPAYGQVEYGLRPEGFDGYAIKQPGGGGTIIIFFAIDSNGELLIGLIEEYRRLVGGLTLNAPRGYVDPGETHSQTAVREGKEETGFDISKRLFPLSLKGSYIDSSIFAVDGPNEGIQYFGCQVYEKELEIDDPDTGTLKFKDEVIEKGKTKDEKIFKCVFHKYDFCIDLPDQFTVVGAAKLRLVLGM